MAIHFLRGAVLVLLAGTSCSSGETVDEWRGSAFPERRPTLTAPGHTLAYIANRLSDTLSVVDLDDFRTLGTVQVGRDPIDIDGPRHLIPDSEHGLAYVALSYPESNLGPHATSLGSNGRLGYVLTLRLDTLAPVGELRTDVSPGDIALSDDHQQLVVSHYDTLKALTLSEDINVRRANLAVIETVFEANKSDADTRRIPVCAVPASVAFASRGDRVFVACTGEDSLVVVDTVSESVLSRVPAGSSIVNKPYAMTRSRSGERLLVSNQVSRSVALFDTEDSPNLLSEAVFEAVPFFADFVDASNYVVPMQQPDTLARVNLESGIVLTQPLAEDCGCVNPAMVRYVSDGRLFLVCEGDHYAPGTLVQLDVETLNCLDHLELGVYPERLELVLP
jgi:DNA-binding beta-propeller fold protein YncE